MHTKGKLTDIKQLKQEMKAKGIRVVSCFNGGLTNDERIYNSRLFALKSAITSATKEQE